LGHQHYEDDWQPIHVSLTELIEIIKAAVADQESHAAGGPSEARHRTQDRSEASVLQ
jgi:hypothetical protein